MIKTSQILNKVEVEHVLQSNYPKESKVYSKYLAAIEDKDVETVREELEFTLDDARFVVNPPVEEEYVADPSNNSSLIVSVYYGETSWLFMGDAEDLRLGEWHYQAQLPNLINKTTPKYAVITSSEEELEDEETMSVLREADADIYLTRKGAILFSTDGEDIATSR